MLNGNIFITGGGFLARGIMWKAEAENWPCRFTIYSRNEHAQDACRRKYPKATYILGDVRATSGLALAAAGHDIIIHTAALKYVDVAENNVSECLAINIGGVQSVIEAAHRCPTVHTVVGISTDKAVEPINVYGLSKAVGERLFQEAAGLLSDISFVQTRYGNVAASTGSVIPVFRRMAAESGEVRITDPNMTRFWIGINGAVELILAACRERSGSIVIPDPMSMDIKSVADAVCPGVPRIIVGARPGERLHERLVGRSESLRTEVEPYEDGNYIYHRNNIPNGIGFEVTSDRATPMDGAMLLELLAQAEEV